MSQPESVLESSHLLLKLELNQGFPVELFLTPPPIKRLLEAMVEEQHIEVVYNYEVKFVNLLPPTNFHK